MEFRSILALTSLLVATAALGDDAWTWTDDEGVVHYSDVPVDGAEEVNLSEYNKKTGARISSGRPIPTRTETPDEFEYETLAIASPTAEETLWNIEGKLNVRIAISPNLLPGHRIRAYLDGNAQDVSSTSFSVENVFRGVHSLRVEVIDGTGRVVSNSNPIQFYVQQNTVAR